MSNSNEMPVEPRVLWKPLTEAVDWTVCWYDYQLASVENDPLGETFTIEQFMEAMKEFAKNVGVDNPATFVADSFRAGRNKLTKQEWLPN